MCRSIAVTAGMTQHAPTDMIPQAMTQKTGMTAQATTHRFVAFLH
jgi:hypothetical protein